MNRPSLCGGSRAGIVYRGRVTKGDLLLRLALSFLFSLALLAVGPSVSSAQDAGRASAEVAYQLGERHFRESALDRAIACYTEAIRLDASHAGAYFSRAWCRLESQDHDGALADFDAAIRLDPKKIWSWIGRGRIRNAKGDFDGAVADTSEAMRLEPEGPGRNCLIGVFEDQASVRRQRGDLAGAIDALGAAIALAPESEDLLEKRAEIRESFGDIEGAKVDYAELARLAPGRGMPGWKLAYLCQDTGDLDGAIRYFGEQIRLWPKDTAGCVGRGTCRAVKGDRAGAERDFAEALRRDPDSGFVYGERAALKYDWGEYRSALEDVYESVGRSNPNDRGYTAILGMLCRLRLGEENASTPELDACFPNLPGWFERDWPSHIAAFLKGEIGEEEFIEAGKSPRPWTAREQSCETWYYAGFMRMIRGDSATAEYYFKKCIEVGLPAFWEHMHAVAELERLELMK